MLDNNGYKYTLKISVDAKEANEQLDSTSKRLDALQDKFTETMATAKEDVGVVAESFVEQFENISKETLDVNEKIKYARDNGQTKYNEKYGRTTEYDSLLTKAFIAAQKMEEILYSSAVSINSFADAISPIKDKISSAKNTTNTVAREIGIMLNHKEIGYTKDPVSDKYVLETNFGRDIGRILENKKISKAALAEGVDRDTLIKIIQATLASKTPITTTSGMKGRMISLSSLGVEKKNILDAVSGTIFEDSVLQSTKNKVATFSKSGWETEHKQAKFLNDEAYNFIQQYASKKGAFLNGNSVTSSGMFTDILANLVSSSGKRIASRNDRGDVVLAGGLNGGEFFDTLEDALFKKFNEIAPGLFDKKKLYDLDDDVTQKKLSRLGDSGTAKEIIQMAKDIQSFKKAFAEDNSIYGSHDRIHGDSIAANGITFTDVNKRKNNQYTVDKIIFDSTRHGLVPKTQQIMKTESGLLRQLNYLREASGEQAIGNYNPFEDIRMLSLDGLYGASVNDKLVMKKEWENEDYMSYGSHGFDQDTTQIKKSAIQKLKKSWNPVFKKFFGVDNMDPIYLEQVDETGRIPIEYLSEEDYNKLDEDSKKKYKLSEGKGYVSSTQQQKNAKINDYVNKQLTPSIVANKTINISKQEYDALSEEKKKLYQKSDVHDNRFVKKDLGQFIVFDDDDTNTDGVMFVSSNMADSDTSSSGFQARGFINAKGSALVRNVKEMWLKSGIKQIKDAYGELYNVEELPDDVQYIGKSTLKNYDGKLKQLTREQRQEFLTVMAREDPLSYVASYSQDNDAETLGPQATMFLDIDTSRAIAQAEEYDKIRKAVYTQEGFAKYIGKNNPQIQSLNGTYDETDDRIIEARKKYIEDLNAKQARGELLALDGEKIGQSRIVKSLTSMMFENSEKNETKDTLMKKALDYFAKQSKGDLDAWGLLKEDGSINENALFNLITGVEDGYGNNIVLDFDNLDSIYSLGVRSPGESGQQVHGRNAASFLKGFFNSIGETNLSGIQLNAKSKRDAAGADEDGDMIKQLTSILGSNESIKTLVKKGVLTGTREQNKKAIYDSIVNGTFGNTFGKALKEDNPQKWNTIVDNGVEIIAARTKYLNDKKLKAARGNIATDTSDVSKELSTATEAEHIGDWQDMIEQSYRDKMARIWMGMASTAGMNTAGIPFSEEDKYKQLYAKQQAANWVYDAGTTEQKKPTELTKEAFKQVNELSRFAANRSSVLKEIQNARNVQKDKDTEEYYLGNEKGERIKVHYTDVKEINGHLYYVPALQGIDYSQNEDTGIDLGEGVLTGSKLRRAAGFTFSGTDRMALTSAALNYNPDKDLFDEMKQVFDLSNENNTLTSRFGNFNYKIDPHKDNYYVDSSGEPLYIRHYPGDPENIDGYYYDENGKVNLDSEPTKDIFKTEVDSKGMYFKKQWNKEREQFDSVYDENGEPIKIKHPDFDSTSFYHKPLLIEGTAKKSYDRIVDLYNTISAGTYSGTRLGLTAEDVDIIDKNLTEYEQTIKTILDRINDDALDKIFRGSDIKHRKDRVNKLRSILLGNKTQYGALRSMVGLVNPGEGSVGLGSTYGEQIDNLNMELKQGKITQEQYDRIIEGFKASVSNEDISIKKFDIDTSSFTDDQKQEYRAKRAIQYGTIEGTKGGSIGDYNSRFVSNIEKIIETPEKLTRIEMAKRIQKLDKIIYNEEAPKEEIEKAKELRDRYFKETPVHIEEDETEEDKTKEESISQNIEKEKNISVLENGTINITAANVNVYGENINNIKNEESNVEEDKKEKENVEKSKSEESKQEESKTDESKSEEHTVEESKVEELKIEEAKIEETKVEEPKPEETKIEETKVEEPKIEGAKIEEPKIEGAKIEEPKVKESKTVSEQELGYIVSENYGEKIDESKMTNSQLLFAYEKELDLNAYNERIRRARESADEYDDEYANEYENFQGDVKKLLNALSLSERFTSYIDRTYGQISSNNRILPFDEDRNKIFDTTFSGQDSLLLSLGTFLSQHTAFENSDKYRQLKSAFNTLKEQQSKVQDAYIDSLYDENELGFDTYYYGNKEYDSFVSNRHKNQHKIASIKHTPAKILSTKITNIVREAKIDDEPLLKEIAEASESYDYEKLLDIMNSLRKRGEIKSTEEGKKNQYELAIDEGIRLAEKANNLKNDGFVGKIEENAKTSNIKFLDDLIGSVSDLNSSYAKTSNHGNIATLFSQSKKTLKNAKSKSTSIDRLINDFTNEDGTIKEEYANEGITEDIVNRLKEAKEKADELAQQIINGSFSEDKINAYIDKKKEKLAKLKEDTSDGKELKESKRQKYENDFNKVLDEVNAAIDNTTNETVKSKLESFKKQVEEALEKVESQENKPMSFDDINDEYKKNTKDIGKNKLGGLLGKAQERGDSETKEEIDDAIEKKAALEKKIERLKTKAESEDTSEEDRQEAEKEIEEAEKELTDIDERISSLQDSLGSASSIVKGLLAGSTEEFFEAIQNFTSDFAKRCVEVVTKLDTAMQNIQSITMKSDEEMEQIRKDVVRQSVDLKVSYEKVAEVQASLYRQGLSREEVNKNTEAVIKYSAVTEGDISSSLKALTTAVNSGLVDNVNAAMDVLVALGDTVATTAEEIAKGMQKSAAAAKNAGVEYEELATMLAVGTATTQLSGTQIGRSMNSIMSRFMKVTNESMSSSSDGSVSINDVEGALANVGVAIRTSSDTFRDFTDVMVDVSEGWEDYSDIQKSNIAYALAGTTQSNTFMSLMTGMAEGIDGKSFRELLEEARNSGGITDEKYNIKTDTIEYALEKFNSALDAVAANMFGLADLVKGIVNFGTEAISFLNATEGSGTFTSIGMIVTAALGLLTGQVWLAAASAFATVIGGSIISAIQTYNYENSTEGKAEKENEQTAAELKTYKAQNKIYSKSIETINETLDYVNTEENKNKTVKELVGTEEFNIIVEEFEFIGERYGYLTDNIDLTSISLKEFNDLLKATNKQIELKNKLETIEAAKKFNLNSVEYTPLTEFATLNKENIDAVESKGGFNQDMQMFSLAVQSNGFYTKSKEGKGQYNRLKDYELLLDYLQKYLTAMGYDSDKIDLLIENIKENGINTIAGSTGDFALEKDAIQWIESGFEGKSSETFRANQEIQKSNIRNYVNAYSEYFEKLGLSGIESYIIDSIIASLGGSIINLSQDEIKQKVYGFILDNILTPSYTETSEDILSKNAAYKYKDENGYLYYSEESEVKTKEDAYEYVKNKYSEEVNSVVARENKVPGSLSSEILTTLESGEEITVEIIDEWISRINVLKEEGVAIDENLLSKLEEYKQALIDLDNSEYNDYRLFDITTGKYTTKSAQSRITKTFTVGEQLNKRQFVSYLNGFETLEDFFIDINKHTTLLDKYSTYIESDAFSEAVSAIERGEMSWESLIDKMVEMAEGVSESTILAADYINGIVDSSGKINSAQMFLDSSKSAEDIYTFESAMGLQHGFLNTDILTNYANLVIDSENEQLQSEGMALANDFVNDMYAEAVANGKDTSSWNENTTVEEMIASFGEEYDTSRFKNTSAALNAVGIKPVGFQRLKNDTTYQDEEGIWRSSEIGSELYVDPEDSNTLRFKYAETYSDGSILYVDDDGTKYRAIGYENGIATTFTANTVGYREKSDEIAATPVAGEEGLFELSGEEGTWREYKSSDGTVLGYYSATNEVSLKDNPNIHMSEADAVAGSIFTDEAIAGSGTTVTAYSKKDLIGSLLYDSYDSGAYTKKAQQSFATMFSEGKSYDEIVDSMDLNMYNLLSSDTELQTILYEYSKGAITAEEATEKWNEAIKKTVSEIQDLNSQIISMSKNMSTVQWYIDNVDNLSMSQLDSAVSYLGYSDWDEYTKHGGTIDSLKIELQNVQLANAEEVVDSLNTQLTNAYYDKNGNVVTIGDDVDKNATKKETKTITGGTTKEQLVGNGFDATTAEEISRYTEKGFAITLNVTTEYDKKGNVLGTKYVATNANGSPITPEDSEYTNEYVKNLEEAYKLSKTGNAKDEVKSTTMFLENFDKIQQANYENNNANVLLKKLQNGTIEESELSELAAYLGVDVRYIRGNYAEASRRMGVKNNDVAIMNAEANKLEYDTLKDSFTDAEWAAASFTSEVGDGYSLAKEILADAAKNAGKYTDEQIAAAQAAADWYESLSETKDETEELKTSWDSMIESVTGNIQQTNTLKNMFSAIKEDGVDTFIATAGTSEAWQEILNSSTEAKQAIADYNEGLISSNELAKKLVETLSGIKPQYDDEYLYGTVSNLVSGVSNEGYYLNTEEGQQEFIEQYALLSTKDPNLAGQMIQKFSWMQAYMSATTDEQRKAALDLKQMQDKDVEYGTSFFGIYGDAAYKINTSNDDYVKDTARTEVTEDLTNMIYYQYVLETGDEHHRDWDAAMNYFGITNKDDITRATTDMKKNKSDAAKLFTSQTGYDVWAEATTNAAARQNETYTNNINAVNRSITDQKALEAALTAYESGDEEAMKALMNNETYGADIAKILENNYSSKDSKTLQLYELTYGSGNVETRNRGQADTLLALILSGDIEAAKTYTKTNTYAEDSLDYYYPGMSDYLKEKADMTYVAEAGKLAKSERKKADVQELQKYNVVSDEYADFKIGYINAVYEGTEDDYVRHQIEGYQDTIDSLSESDAKREESQDKLKDYTKGTPEYYKIMRDYLGAEADGLTDLAVEEKYLAKIASEEADESEKLKAISNVWNYATNEERQKWFGITTDEEFKEKYGINPGDYMTSEEQFFAVKPYEHTTESYNRQFGDMLSANSEMSNDDFVAAVKENKNLYNYLISEYSGEAGEIFRDIANGSLSVKDGLNQMNNQLGRTVKQANATRASIRSLDKELMNLQYLKTQGKDKWTSEEKDEISSMMGYADYKEAISMGITDTDMEQYVNDAVTEKEEDLTDVWNNAYSQSVITVTPDMNVNFEPTVTVAAGTDYEEFVAMGMDEQMAKDAAYYSSLGYEITFDKTIEKDENGDIIKVKYGMSSVKATGTKSSGVKKSTGGGGSSKDKVKEKWDKVIAVDKHLINLINTREEIAQSEGRLTDYGSLLEQEKKYQEQYRSDLEAAIAEEKKHMNSLTKNSDAWQSAKETIMSWEEELANVDKTLIENEKKIKENAEAIRQTAISVQDMIRKEYETRKQIEKDMLSNTVSMQNTVLEAIKQRYQEESDLRKKSYNEQIEYLNKEKELLQERFNARSENANRIADLEELEELKRQYSLISLDSTRSKERLELAKQIADKEKAINEQADKEYLESRLAMIDDQVTAYEDMIESEQSDLEAFLEDANNFTEELNNILAMSQEDMLSWLQNNVKDFALSTAEAQQQMIDGWTDTFNAMHNITERWNEEILALMNSGTDAIMEFMLGSDAYANMTDEEKAAEEYRIQNLIDAWVNAYSDGNEIFSHTDEWGGTIASTTSKISEDVSKILKNKEKESETQKEDSKIAQDTREATRVTATLNLEKQSIISTDLKQVLDDTGLLATAAKTNNLWWKGTASSASSKAYATGGLADYTGWAWVDGTPQNPEYVLSATQWKDLLNLDYNNHVLAGSNYMNGQYNSIEVGGITINTNSISDDADIEELANKIGDVLNEKINNSGFSTSRLCYR